MTGANNIQQYIVPILFHSGSVSKQYINNIKKTGANNIQQYIVPILFHSGSISKQYLNNI